MEQRNSLARKGMVSLCDWRVLSISLYQVLYLIDRLLFLPMDMDTPSGGLSGMLLKKTVTSPRRNSLPESIVQIIGIAKKAHRMRYTKVCDVFFFIFFNLMLTNCTNIRVFGEIGKG